MNHPQGLALSALPADDDTLIPRADLPRYLPRQEANLARWAHEGQGPAYIKVGRRLVAYRAGDLRRVATAHRPAENTIAIDRL